MAGLPGSRAWVQVGPLLSPVARNQAGSNGNELGAQAQNNKETGMGIGSSVCWDFLARTKIKFKSHQIFLGGRAYAI